VTLSEQNYCRKIGFRCGEKAQQVEHEFTNCRVEIWRGGAKAPFPDPAHQTGRADFPHLGFRTRLFMLSPTAELC
jgi:hypothetical protein